MAEQKKYSIYDKNDVRVFVGNIDECSTFLGINKTTLRGSYLNKCEYTRNGYLIVRYDDMIEWESYRRRKEKWR